MASVLGVIEEPMMTSTLSLISLCVFFTAADGSVASSSRMISTAMPPRVFGTSANTFFSGMPSEAAGPVAASVAPTLICAATEVVTSANVNTASSFFIVSSLDKLLFSGRNEHDSLLPTATSRRQ